MGNGNGYYTAEQFIKAIPGTGGIVSTIAKRVGCDWKTAKKYIDEYPTVNRAYQNEREAILDMAEGAVFKNIEKASRGDGDTADAKWYLTKMGKHRGYVDNRTDLTSGGEPIQIQRIVENRGNDE